MGALDISCSSTNIYFQCKDMRENLLKIREELGEHLIPGEDEFYSSLRPFEQIQKNEYPQNSIGMS